MPNESLSSEFIGSIFSETIYLLKEDQAPMVKAESPEVKPVEIAAAPEVSVEKVSIEIPPRPAEKIEIPKIKKSEPVAAITPEEKIETPVSVAFLGKNEKQILLLVEDPKAEFLDAKDGELIGKILSAVHLTMNDVAIVNFAKNTSVNWQQLKNSIPFQKFVSFSPSSKLLHKELNIPSYQIKNAGGLSFFMSDDIKSLHTDIEKKKKLWSTLQIFFKK